MNRSGRLFVYGSLLRGQMNHHLIAGARFLAYAQTVAGFALVDLGEYPGMVVGGRGAVSGELYEIDRRLLSILDPIEDHPAFYVRSRIALQGGDTAEAYILRSEQARRLGAPRGYLKTGNWRQRATSP